MLSKVTCGLLAGSLISFLYQAVDKVNVGRRRVNCGESELEVGEQGGMCLMLQNLAQSHLFYKLFRRFFIKDVF